jgi:hypothetical protein
MRVFIDRKTTIAAATMAGLTAMVGVVAAVAVLDGGSPSADQISSSAGATATIIENGSIVVIALDPVLVSAPGDGTASVSAPSGGPDAGSPGATTTSVGTSPPSSGSTTSVATTVPPPTTRAGLYTVSGWLIPSNYDVPSKWWGQDIPDYPVGNWSKCALEDDGWACEVG